MAHSCSLGGFAPCYSWTVLRSQMKDGVAEDSAHISSAETHIGMGLAVEEQCCSPGGCGQRLVAEVKQDLSLVFAP